MTDYYELAELADQILGIADENLEELTGIIDDLDPNLKEELLDSDFLNAYQVFYYYFRSSPAEIVKERLMLEPATALRSKVHIDDYDVLEIYFEVSKNEPRIIVSDGDKELRTFSGKKAYSDAVSFAKDALS